MRYQELHDLYGAPEIFVTGVGGHEMAAPGVLRFIFATLEDQGQSVVRVKLLMPIISIAPCMTMTARFLQGHGYELPADIRLS